MAVIQDEQGNNKPIVTDTSHVFDVNGNPLHGELFIGETIASDDVEEIDGFAHESDVNAISQNLTIKSKTFNVNTGGASQVTFEMDDAEQIPIHVKSGSNDIFSLAERTGIRWKFSVGRLTLETSVHNGYFYEALFNKDITITVYYIC